MSKRHKAYYLAISFIVLITLIIILSPNSHAAIEITVDEYENTTMIFDSNQLTDSTEIERLLFWHPMQNLEEPNYYDFSEIFIDWNDLRKPSGINTWQAERLLRGEGKQYADSFVKAEENYGVNAVFLIALTRHETGNFTNRLYYEKNNIFSFKAYDDHVDSATDFESIEECIDYSVKYIKDEYLTEGGEWFKGYSIESMNIHYATDQAWAKSIKNMFN